MTGKAMAGRWRPMRADDLAAVAAISDAVHGMAYTERPAIYAERLALYPAGCHVFARDDGGAVEGYLISHPWRRDDPPTLDRPLGAIPADADGYYLHDLALLPSTRGAGAGRAALALVLRQAVAAGFDDITLTAVGGADGFWAAQGFVYADRDGASPYGPGTHLMRRTAAMW
jgi:GNAT superfamily N-acetyltransferase